MSDKVQISEKQAREMIDIVNACDTYQAIVVLRNSGYIKQSKLEKARADTDVVLREPNEFSSGFTNGIKVARALYEAAIAELLEDKSNG